jgi:nicotinamidase-related amidase
MDELLDRKDCALALIDIQEKLLAVMDGKEALLENAARLARFAAIIGLPVLVTEQEKLGPTASDLAVEVAGMSPISKLEFDACRRPEFARALEGLGRNTIIVAGIESHICITQTVLHLLSEYQVHVVSDAVSSRTPENRLVALDRMREAGAVISSTEMVMYELLAEAGTDEFRETLKLVK